MPTKGFPAGGPKHLPKIDPIEVRLIEIRDALTRITEILQDAQRQARATSRKAA